MKYCVVSLIFNNYEPIREPLEVDPDADYFMFTDNPNLTSTGWKIIYVEELDKQELNGIQKMLIFKYSFYKYIPNSSDYDYFMMIDGSIVLLKSLEPIINYIENGNYDLSIALHPMRNSLDDEYQAWIQCRGLNKLYLNKFVELTKDYDDSIKGLTETTIKIFKNTNIIINFIDDMYDILSKVDFNDKNDQCYFTYILSKYIDKLNINYHPAALYRDSKYMYMALHGSNVKTIFENPINRPGETIEFLGKTIKINNIEDYEDRRY